MVVSTLALAIISIIIAFAILIFSLNKIIAPQNYRDYSPEELRSAIILYLQKHGSALTSEIAEALNADIVSVSNMLDLLETENVISEASEP